MFSRQVIHKRRLLVVAGIAVALGLASCDTFSVRDSEDPEGSGGVDEYVDPYEPELVISNLVNSVEDQNAFNYDKLFTEDFVFVPDPTDVLELENYYPGVYADWDVEAERQVGQHMLDRGQAANALLSFVERDDDKTDSTYVLQADYRLRIVDMQGLLESYVGTAVFHIRLGKDGLWYIREWQDFRPEAGEEDEKDTWGMLKGEIRATT
jgi:hypothetical protein